MSAATPTSLVNARGAAPTNRRTLAGILVANGVPNGVVPHAGIPTRGAKYLHVAAVSHGADSDVTLWVKLEVSGLWAKHEGFGINGLLTLATDIAEWRVVELNGVDKVYLEMSSPGVGITGVDAWLAGHGDSTVS